jgi:hypothetical protein
VIECSRDHIRLLYDLPNGTTLTQEIVASSVFLVIKILATEHHRLNSTFLHVTFRSQSLLKPTGDQTGSIRIEGPEKTTRGGEWEPIKIPRRNSVYISNPTRHPSLLTRPRPTSYRKSIGLQNRVRNRSGNMKRSQQNHMRDRR